MRDIVGVGVGWAEPVSGVVDWVETSWGPAALDVAHACTYLAMLHGVDAAHRFADAYRRRAADRRDEDEYRYWNVMDIVGYLPDPEKVVQPWRDGGAGHQRRAGSSPPRTAARARLTS